MKNLALSLAFALLSTQAYSQELKVVTHEIKTSGFTQQDPIATAGQVIDIADRIVALGERIYTLVQHGKPSNTTAYAPVAIVPRNPTSREIVDPLDLEECSFPTRKSFETVVSRGNREVVRFEYELVFSHSCSYEGKGKYIQVAMIKPTSVVTKYGWDLNATMRLSGMMNHGKKADPVVGAFLTMKLAMNNLGVAYEKEHGIHITGDGQINPKK